MFYKITFLFHAHALLAEFKFRALHFQRSELKVQQWVSPDLAQYSVWRGTAASLHVFHKMTFLLYFWQSLNLGH